MIISLSLYILYNIIIIIIIIIPGSVLNQSTTTESGPLTNADNAVSESPILVDLPLMPTTSNSVSRTTSEETLTNSEQSETTVTMSRPAPVESNLGTVVGGAVGGLVIVNVVVVAVVISAIMVFHKYKKGQCMITELG